MSKKYVANNSPRNVLSVYAISLQEPGSALYGAMKVSKIDISIDIV